MTLTKKFQAVFLLSLFLFTTSLVLFADSAPPVTPVPAVSDSPAFSPAPAALPPVGSSILQWLSHLVGFTVPAWLVSLCGLFLSEVVLRIWKTDKPLSLLYFTRDGLVYLSMLCHAVAVFLDKLLQNSNYAANPPPKV